MPGVKGKCGGKRDGAGRPRTSDKAAKERITVCLDPFIIEKLKAAAKAERRSVSDLVADALVYGHNAVDPDEYQKWLNPEQETRAEFKARHEAIREQYRLIYQREFYKCSTYEEVDALHYKLSKESIDIDAYLSDLLEKAGSFAYLRIMQSSDRQNWERLRREVNANMYGFTSPNSYASEFSKCASILDLKRVHRTFCKKLHPDAGGNSQEYMKMTEAYEQAKLQFA